MSIDTDTNGLHLPSLSISGFRGINRLDIARLGRVTLLAGKNGVGKTTVLDAIRLYAARGHVLTMREILLAHEEVDVVTDGDAGQVERPDFEALYFGRDPQIGDVISIGVADGADALEIELVDPEILTDDLDERSSWRGSAAPAPALRIAVGHLEEFETVFDDDYRAPHAPTMRSRRLWRGDGRDRWPPDVACASIGPESPRNRDLADSWDNVGFTALEEVALGALELATNSEIHGVMAVSRSAGSRARRILVKGADNERFPLRSLGDGAVRTFGTAVGLANARDGLLLIDEAENGLHHTLQRPYWTMVLSAAREYNVQVLATTHSWDCVAGFAQAAFDDEESEGIAIRLEADDDEGGVRAIEYTERMLKVAADQGIEVR